MLKQITINFLCIASGVVTGAYLPLAVIYLMRFFRRERFGFILMLKAALRLVLIALLFCIIILAPILISRLFGLSDEASFKAFVFWASAFWGSLFIGIILFIIGLVRGRRRVASDSGT